MTEEGQVTSSALVEAQSSLNKREDNLDEAVLMSEDPGVWVNTLSPCIASVSLLGELMLISTKKDFSLKENTPIDGFKYVKHPNSFRASLVQVCNDAYFAYDQANSSMQKIRMLSAEIPDSVNEAMKILITGSPETKKHLVPLSLSQIQRRVNMCKDEAEKTEKKYVEVVRLIDEVQQTATATKQTYEERVNKAEQQKAAYESQKKRAEEQKKEDEKEKKKLEKMVESYRDAYQKTMDEFPDAALIGGLQVAGSLTQGINTALSVFVQRATNPFGLVQTPQGPNMNPCTQEVSQQTTVPEKGISVELASKAQAIQTNFASLKLLMNPEGDQKINWEKIEKGPEGCEYFASEFQQYKNQLKDIGGKIEGKYVKLLGKGLKLCRDIEAVTKGINKDEEKVRSISQEAWDLLDESEALLPIVNRESGNNPTPAKMMTIDAPIKQADPMSMSPMLDAAKFKVAESKQQLRAKERDYEQAAEKLEKRNEELKMLVSNLAELDLKRINFDEISKILVEGIKALAAVREEWTKLVSFFKAIANIVDAKLHLPLTEFMERAEVFHRENLSINDSVHEFLYSQANKGVQAAKQVNTIASIYCEISHNYLMDNVIRLGKLAALDARTDAGKISEQQTALEKECKKALEGMETTIHERTIDFKKRIKLRIHKIEDTMEKVLPASSEKEKHALEMRVKKSLDMDVMDL